MPPESELIQGLDRRLRIPYREGVGIRLRFTAPGFPAPFRRAVMPGASGIHFRVLMGSGLAPEAVAVNPEFFIG